MKLKKYEKILMFGLVIILVGCVMSLMKLIRLSFDVYVNLFDDKGICLIGEGVEKLVIYLFELEWY